MIDKPGPHRPWFHRRSRQEDKDAFYRREAERLSQPLPDSWYDAIIANEQSRKLVPVESLESALYGQETLSPANVRYGKRQRRRGMRNAEEFYS